MSDLVIARNGRVGCGPCFASCQGDQIPVTFNLLKQMGNGDAVSPDHVAFSSFRVARAGARGSKTAHEAGDHVALAYNTAEFYFSAVIVRCDTWAVQWAVERTACLVDASVSRLTTLCANTVCGVASSAVEQRVFVATRFDAPLTSRAENKEWRQFLAAPRVVTVGLESEGVADVAALDKNAFLVVTQQGSLAIVHLRLNILRFEPKGAESFYTVEVLDQKVSDASSASRLAIYNDEADHAYAAVYTHGATAFELVEFSSTSFESDGAAAPKAVVKVSTSVPIKTLDFVGPLHLCITGTAAAQNLQFLSLVPGSGGLDAIAFDPLTSSHRILGVHYNTTAEEVTLLSTPFNGKRPATMASAPVWSSIIATSLSFSTGPFTQGALSVASWGALSNPYRHFGPRTSRLAHFEPDGEDEKDEDVQVLQIATARDAGRWTPLTICYALAAERPQRQSEVAVFSVETAPSLHTRLIKQWHNATTGLKVVFETVRTQAYNALTLPWNPRHVRRALRLLGHQRLSALFHCAATAILASERVSSGVAFSDATTATIEIGLQVVTLARQVGAALTPADVKTVAVMLRASRDCGHELLRYASRMELLMESCLQQRAMNRVLGRRSALLEDAESSAAHELQENFYGISAELQTERTLHTRYNSNAWAQHLDAHKLQYCKEATAASRLLAAIGNVSDKTADRSLSDWWRLGTAPHQDPRLNEFERPLL